MEKKLETVESELPKITGKDYKSPVKFELEIQRQRILYILHFAIKKMEVMGRLAFMLKDDCKVLKPYLKTPELDFIKFACSKYLPGGQPEAMRKKSSILKYSRILDNINLNQYDQEDEFVVKSLLGSLADDQSVDYHIAEVIQIITSNEPLVKYLESVQNEIDEPIQNLIECVIHLKHLILEKLMITSKEQMDNDKKLRVAYKSNFIITQNIKRLQEQIEKQRKELGSELEKKNAILKTYNEKLENLREDFETEMMKTVQKSEKIMMNDSFNSEAKQVELEREANEASSHYAALLETNLSEENHLRQKRNKVEAQLSSWLAKYDNDVGEKQTEYEKLEKQYNDMKKQFDDLTASFEEQSKQYEVLMAEKEAEEQRIYEEMAYDFLRNRAARRIQRAWRAYWQRKLERRKGRRAKGKAKEKKKFKKDEPKLTRQTDANVALKKTFKKKGYLFEEMDSSKQFTKDPVKVDLDT